MDYVNSVLHHCCRERTAWLAIAVKADINGRQTCEMFYM